MAFWSFLQLVYLPFSSVGLVGALSVWNINEMCIWFRFCPAHVGYSISEASDDETQKHKARWLILHIDF